MNDAWRIDYAALLGEGHCETIEAAVAWLLEELPYTWHAAYKGTVGRPVDVQRIDCGPFQYLYDLYPGTNEDPTGAEARTVAAIGQSSPRDGARDDSRLRGWVAATEVAFGKEWDKGHFVAHSIGGAVDRAEINVFVQRRALNRGWSDEGKVYRNMEDHCAGNPGTLFFSRPMYSDQRARPDYLEVGVLRGPNDLWVEMFDNR